LAPDQPGIDRHTRYYRSGSVIFMEGEPGHEMFVLLHGSVLLYQVVGKKIHDETAVTFGQTVLEIATLRDGDFFGEMAVLDGRPRSTCAVALSDLKVVVLDEANFDQVISARPEFALRIMREFSRRVRDLETQIRAQGLPK
jgi:CRP-like cAMP-binding protein